MNEGAADALKHRSDALAIILSHTRTPKLTAAPHHFKCFGEQPPQTCLCHIAAPHTYERQPHPSVKTWLVHQSSKVRLPLLGCIAPSNEHDERTHSFDSSPASSSPVAARTADKICTSQMATQRKQPERHAAIAAVPCKESTPLSVRSTAKSVAATTASSHHRTRRRPCARASDGAPQAIEGVWPRPQLRRLRVRV